MRNFPMACLFLLVFCAPALAEPADKSVRDAGFVDIEPKPFRLMLLAKDLTTKEVKARQALLRKEIKNSNIVLISAQADAKGVTPDAKPIKDLSKFTRPQFWLFAPDDRVIPFDPTGALSVLLQSKLRQAIQLEVTDSLCTVLFLESKNDQANDEVLVKIAKVLTLVNQSRKLLEKAPDVPVRMLTLGVAQREEERWTLWGLGEDAADSEMPKVAVIFGRMRRAGVLLEGAKWNEIELLAQITGLAESLEVSADRKQALGLALPFRWDAGWPEALAKTLEFDPNSDEVKAEIKKLLAKPLAAKRKARQPTPHELMSGIKNENGVHADPHQEHGLEIRPEDPAPNPVPIHAPSLFASMLVALILFAVGIAGWIALGVGVFILERRGTTGKAS